MADLNVQLLPWQQDVYSDPTRFKVVAAGRRTGKSRLAAWLLIINGLQADKGHVFYVAPTQGQARDIMWQTLMELGHPVISGSHINNLQIKLINGATISLKGADRPETMRGVSLKYLVMDEYADMKPDVWEQILRPALADQKGEALFIGTPMGRNHFYELYKYAELGVYMEAFRMGIVDRTEVLKKNPEIFDKEGVMRRTEERQLLQRQIAAMTEQIKNLEGDLQTAQRESISDRKKVEVEKFKTRLKDISADAKADRRVQLNNLQSKVKLEAEKLANVRKDASSAPEA